jgi:hypothetical protein
MEELMPRSDAHWHLLLNLPIHHITNTLQKT